MWFQNIFTEPHDLKFLKNFLKPLSKLIIYSIINNAQYKQYNYITFFSYKSSDDLLIVLSHDWLMSGSNWRSGRI
jgi:hypothetical protein